MMHHRRSTVHPATIAALAVAAACGDAADRSASLTPTPTPTVGAAEDPRGGAMAVMDDGAPVPDPLTRHLERVRSIVSGLGG